MSVDAFARQRVCAPHTLFDVAHIGGVHPHFDYSGNYTYQRAKSAVELESSGGRVSIAQSKCLVPYQSGKSLLIILTFNMSDSQTSVERVGYFDVSNGVFFQKNNGTNYFVIRNNGVDTSVAQSSWNQRQLGAGRTVLDPSRSQIFWCDLEWLGVGSVLCGFGIDRELIPCHRFDHANIVSDAVYMKQAMLPVRYEITESANSQSVLQQLCSTVISEGGYELVGPPRGIGNSVLNTINNGTTETVLALRIAPTYTMETIVVPASVHIVANVTTGNRAAYYEITRNSVDLSTTWVDASNSRVQYATNDDISVSNGDVAYAGYATSQSTANLTEGGLFTTQILRNLQRTSDIITVRIKALSGNPECGATINWYEF